MQHLRGVAPFGQGGGTGAPITNKPTPTASAFGRCSLAPAGCKGWAVHGETPTPAWVPVAVPQHPHHVMLLCVWPSNHVADGSASRSSSLGPAGQFAVWVVGSHRPDRHLAWTRSLGSSCLSFGTNVSGDRTSFPAVIRTAVIRSPLNDSRTLPDLIPGCGSVTRSFEMWRQGAGSQVSFHGFRNTPRVWHFKRSLTARRADRVCGGRAPLWTAASGSCRACEMLAGWGGPGKPAGRTAALRDECVSPASGRAAVFHTSPPPLSSDGVCARWVVQIGGAPRETRFETSRAPRGRHWRPRVGWSGRAAVGPPDLRPRARMSSGVRELAKHHCCVRRIP